MRLISAAVATIRGVAAAAEVGVEAGTEAAVAGTETAVEAGAAAVEAATAAAEGVEAAAVEGGLSLLKIGTLATLALTALIEIGMLIYEGVKGHEHMVELQGYGSTALLHHSVHIHLRSISPEDCNMSADGCKLSADTSTTLSPAVSRPRRSRCSSTLQWPARTTSTA